MEREEEGELGASDLKVSGEKITPIAKNDSATTNLDPHLLLHPPHLQLHQYQPNG